MWKRLTEIFGMISCRTATAPTSRLLRETQELLARLPADTRWMDVPFCR
jgi:hypothetical protein